MRILQGKAILNQDFHALFCLLFPVLSLNPMQLAFSHSYAHCDRQAKLHLCTTIYLVT